MKTSAQWAAYFQANLQVKRINWDQSPQITPEEQRTILASLQAWQLGETSDGKNLLKASARYAERQGDADYVKAVRLFIREEQKHGANLGTYLDLVGKPRIKNDWGDTLFRKIRYFNTSMELWTLAVITVESAAQIFYQCLKDATKCRLLQEICTDILIDEEEHIYFQQERLGAIYSEKGRFLKIFTLYAYPIFFFCTALTVWAAHRKVFKAGNNGLRLFLIAMKQKYIQIKTALEDFPDAQIPSKKFVRFPKTPSHLYEN
jgi:hypothetical protein